MYQGRAWKADEFGDPGSVLKLQDDEWGEPTEGSILIKVSACGIGLPDLFMTQGHYPIVTAPPVRPGQEVSGYVVSAPAGSTFEAGERVMGMTIYEQGWWRGGLAEYAFVQEHKCLRVPEGMTDEEAAGFVIGFRTAHAALIERVPLSAGQRVLILGAAGSSGAAAIKLAKCLGAEVIAIAGSAEKLRFCETIGADHVLSYCADGWADDVRTATGGAGVDVIFDPVGGKTAAAALKAIDPWGRIALVGFASGEWLKLDSQDMVLRNYSAVGVFSGGFQASEDALAYSSLADMAARGALTTPLGRVYEFDQVPTAISSLSKPGPGKTVVRVNQAVKI